MKFYNSRCCPVFGWSSVRCIRYQTTTRHNHTLCLVNCGSAKIAATFRGVKRRLTGASFVPRPSFSSTLPSDERVPGSTDSDVGKGGRGVETHEDDIPDNLVEIRQQFCPPDDPGPHDCRYPHPVQEHQRYGADYGPLYRRRPILLQIDVHEGDEEEEDA